MTILGQYTQYPILNTQYSSEIPYTPLMSDRTYNTLRILFFSLLVVWGLYTLIAYLAVPVHQSVLLSDAGRQAVAGACSGASILCAGWNALFPFIGQTFTWASPFLWYAIISLLFFGAMLVRVFMRDGEWKARFTLRPVWLIVLFLAAVWLHFTVIAQSSNGDMPYSRMYEPTSQVYPGADPEQMKVLQDSFYNLKERGCLELFSTSPNGAEVYDMKGLCMQGAFFTNVLPHALVVIVFLFELLVLGRFLLRLLGLKQQSPLLEVLFSAGVGACGFMFILWVVAVIAGAIEQPIYSTAFGWGLFLLVPGLLYRDALYWVRSAWDRQWQIDEKPYGAMIIVGWVLISLLALNFLNVVRPFPIGWDDLGRYLNMPRLLVSYGFFIPQLASYQWEYMTSLGFLLFGYDSIFAATASMMINWSAGVLAILTVYVFTRYFLGPKHGTLAALLYYALPVVGHFSFADMKVDNAVFAIGTLSILALFVALFPSAKQEEVEGEERVIDYRWLIVAGVLAGFAFSLKPTAIMTFLAMGTVLFGISVHWAAFLGTVSLSWALYTLEGRFNVSEIARRVYGDPSAISKPIVLGALLALGVGLTGYSAFLQPERFRRTSIRAGIIIATFFVTIAPWLLFNNLSFGNVIPRLVMTAPNRITPSLVLGKDEQPVDFGQPIHRLPAELQVDTSKCIGTSKTEELDRYWGYGSGWSHYFTLPWRLVMNIDSAGYYVTTYPALLLFPLLLLLPHFWTKKGRWLRWMALATLFMLVQWVFFANGIPWYGLGMFIGFVVALEAMVARAPDIPSLCAMWVLIILSLFTAFSQRFWQFDQQKNLFEYPLGKVSAEAMRERTIPYYDDIRESIEQRRMQMPDRPYVYRMGTFIPYFIPKNLEVLPLADHQLDVFKCLNQEKDAELTLKRLQALGFNAMIFDTNTATIERDTKGSLHQKVDAFVKFVNTPGLGLNVPIFDLNAGIAYILLP